VARDLQYSLATAVQAIMNARDARSHAMFPNEDLQRWAGRICLLLAGTLGFMGYHFANVRFLPIMAGFAILAGVCYGARREVDLTRPLRHSGRHPSL
jgi:hypothetical protein